MSRFAEHFLRAPITAVSLLLVTSMVPAAPTPSLGQLVEHCEVDGGDGRNGCCRGAQPRFKIKRGTGDGHMSVEAVETRESGTEPLGTGR